MADESGDIGYAGAAQGYWELGWRGILPMRRGFKKWPPSIKCANKRERPPKPCLPGCECISWTGYDAVTPSWPDIAAWSEQFPDGNLCLHMPDGFIAIDVDAYGAKTGGQAFAEAIRRWGSLPSTPRSSSRRDGVSGIRIFRVPPGTALETRIVFPELGIGDIEIIQRHHRYVICWPSIHPEGGQYWWLDDNGQYTAAPAAATVPDLPQAWIDGLRVVPRSEIVTGERVDIAAILTPGDPSIFVQQRLSQAFSELNLPGQSRHDTACRHVLALMRMGKNGEPGVLNALRLLCDVLVAARRVDNSDTEEGTRAEFERMVFGERAARELSAPGITDWISSMVVEPAPPVLNGQVDQRQLIGNPQVDHRSAMPDQRPIESSPAPPTFDPTSQSPPSGEKGGDQGPTSDTSGSVIVDDSAPRSHLEEIEQGFWQSRESLAMVYQTAMARMCPPWAVLGICAARALAQVRPHVTLPPLIGGTGGSLNWFGAIVAGSAGGKTTSGSAARLLVPGHLLTCYQGTGEGILATFGQAGDPGDPNSVPEHESIFLDVDEVDGLGAVSGRVGSTTMPILRTAFSGATLAFSYSNKDKRRYVREHTYRMTGIIGMQPKKAGWVLADADGGTPQRFMWFPATDSRVRKKRPWEAGPLTLPSPSEWLYPRELSIPQVAEDLLLDEHVKRQQGGTDALDGHALFCREKFAYALTILDGRIQMSEEDWQLSGIASDISLFTRTMVVDELKAASRIDALDRGEVRGIEQAAADESKQYEEAERVRHALRWVLGRLETAGPNGISNRDLTLAADSKRTRRWIPAALSIGQSNGLIRPIEGTTNWVKV